MQVCCQTDWVLTKCNCSRCNIYWSFQIAWTNSVGFEFNPFMPGKYDKCLLDLWYCKKNHLTHWPLNVLKKLVSGSIIFLTVTEIEIDFTKDIWRRYFYFLYFPNCAYACKISSKLSGCFWLLWTLICLKIMNTFWEEVMVNSTKHFSFNIIQKGSDKSNISPN